MLNKHKNRKIDNLASEIDTCHNDNTTVYQAIKYINRKAPQHLLVRDKDSRNLTEPKAV